MPTANHFDPVNAPEHYVSGGIECIQAIKAQLSPEEYKGFLKGNVAKYLWRESKKGGIQSLEKAEWYLKALIEVRKEEKAASQCKDGFCPMPNVRHGPQQDWQDTSESREIFSPINDA